MGLRLQPTLTGDLEKRFKKYSNQHPETKVATLAAQLIDLGLRVREHTVEGGRTNREILEYLVSEVAEIKRANNNIFINTFVSDYDISKEQLVNAKEKLRQLIILSDDKAQRFLNNSEDNK